MQAKNLLFSRRTRRAFFPLSVLSAYLTSRLRISRLAIWLLLAITLTACAMGSVFVSYPSQAKKYRLALIEDDTEKVLEQLDKKRNDKDKILYLMERGRIAQLSGDYAGSLKDFDDVINAVRENEDKAKISASDLGAKSSAMISNDNAIPYKGESFEHILVHHYQALNYLAKGDLSGAGVEIRRANVLQVEALEEHTKDIAKAEQQAEEQGVPAERDSAVSSHFAEMDEAAGKVKSSFQNAYTFYLSGLVYEALGQANDAYIDYKKALQIFPGNRYLQNDLLRLARRLGMREDYDQFKKRFNRDAAETKPETGSLVVIFEQDFIAAKDEVKVPIPTIHGWVTVAFPIYREPWHANMPLAIRSGDSLLGSTDEIVDLHGIAARALKENMPAIIIRQTIRATSKYALQKNAADNGGLFAGLATQIYNIASENADRRSWLTLPNNAQILRAEIPAGEHQIYAHTQDTPIATIDMKPGRIVIVKVTRAGGNYISQQFNL